MSVTNSFSYAFGPFVALTVIGILAIVLRWAFSQRKTSVVAAAAKPGVADDYGILVPVAQPSNYAEGEMLRRKLEDSGIRANLAQTLDGPRVLVWPLDAERARMLIR